MAQTSASDVRAGGAFVEIGPDLGPLTKGLKVAEGMVKDFGAQISALGQRLTVAGTAMLAPITLATQRFAALGDDIAKMGRRTGLSTEAVSELSHVADLSGASIEGLEKAIRRQQRAMIDASDGLTEYVREFDRMNLDVRELMALSPEEAFLRIGAAIGELPTQFQRSTAAQKIFGRSGTELLPMFNLGAEGIRHYRREAERLGVSLGGAAAKNAERLTDMWARQTAAIRGLAFTIGNTLAPWFDKLITVSTNLIVNFREFVGANPQLVTGFRDLAVALIATGTALTGIGTGIQFLSKFFSPGGILVAGVGVVLYMTGALDGLIQKIQDFANETTVGGKSITDWFKLIGEALRLMIPVWDKGFDAIISVANLAWMELKKGFLGAAVFILTKLHELLDDIGVEMLKAAEGLSGVAAVYVKGAGTAFRAMSEGVFGSLKKADAGAKGLTPGLAVERAITKGKIDAFLSNTKDALKGVGDLLGGEIGAALDKIGKGEEAKSFLSIFKDLGKAFEEFVAPVAPVGMGVPTPAAAATGGVSGTFSGVAAQQLARQTRVFDEQLEVAEQQLDVLRSIDSNTGGGARFA